MLQGTKAPSAIALGCFDGLHRGHMAVIQAAISYENMGLRPHVLLFDIHPQKVISGTAPKELLTLERTEEKIKELGATPVTVNFKELCEMSPSEFVTEFLIKTVNAKAVACGYNYRFGKGGRGDTALLKELCRKNKIALSVVEKIEYEGEAISSTRIRLAIEKGQIEIANAMLGREFSYNFIVVSGDKVGRLIGAPTINQHFPDDFVIPKFGVYASRTIVDGRAFASVTNIGKRPSFTSNELRSETCILDFSGDLYGQNIEVGLISFLRPEIKFDSLEELSFQIRKDSEKSRTLVGY